MILNLTEQEIAQALRAVQIALAAANYEARQSIPDDRRTTIEARRHEWFELGKRLQMAQRLNQPKGVA